LNINEVIAMNIKNNTGKGRIWGIMSLCGIPGVAFYTLDVVLGGILWRGYSHLSQAVSKLTGRARRTPKCCGC